MSTLVLTGQPKLSSIAAQGLGRAATGFGEGLFDGLQKKRQSQNMSSLFSQISPEDQQIAQLFLSEHPGAQSFGKELFKQRGQELKEQRKIQQQKIEQEEALKGAKETAEFLENPENLQYAGSRFSDLLNPNLKVNPLGGLNRKAVEKREEYTRSGFLLADQVYTHFNKGTISEAKLELIKKDLAPHGNLSERENIARVRALKRIMGLKSDANPSTVNKIIDQEISKVKKSSKPTLQEIFGE
jgi:hypothetical protein